MPNRPDVSAPRLSDVSPAVLAQSLAGRGVWLDVGLCTMRVRSDVAVMAEQLRSVYRHFPWVNAAEWADEHLDLMRVGGLRRWVKPQVRMHNDGQVPFDPFPADAPLPLMEWSANWLIGRRSNHVLLLHSGVVERDGLALVMPALPGSGKSTLTAALSLSGWRLLSDEFGAVQLDTGRLMPVLKPAALKNQSIDVIRRFAPHAELGPLFPKTRKGTVAHVAPARQAVDQVHVTASPGLILLPRWQAGERTQFIPVDERMAFSTLAFNAFNYAVVGAEGFHAVVRMVRQCPAYQLIYSDLSDALARLDEQWPEIRRHQAARAEAAGQQAAQESWA